MNTADHNARIAGCTAFVTGASTGLGRAFAAMLRDEGVEVWGTARDAARVPAGLRPVALELADGPAAERAFLARVSERRRGESGGPRNR